MAQYTAEFLAAARRGYETTDQPMRELARELGIGITTLSTLAENHGWAKRSQRKRGLSPAMQLLEEVKALAGTATHSAHSRAGGNPESEELGPRLRGDERRESGPHPSRLGEERLAPQDDGAPPTPNPSPPFAEPVIGPAQEGRTRWLTEGGEHSEFAAPVALQPADLLIKLEQILAQLIAQQHLAPSNGIQSPQGARTLTMLIQSMRALQGLRGPALTHTGSVNDDDDDMPTDLDEFRNELARRIDALVASEEDEDDADAHSGRADLEAGQQ